VHRFCQGRHPIRSLCDDFDELPWDYPCWKFKHCCRFVDANSDNAALSVPLTFSAENTANSLSLAIWDFAACMIAESVRLKIIDPPLMLIFRKWWRYYLHHLCRERQPIQSLYENFNE